MLKSLLLSPSFPTCLVDGHLNQGRYGPASYAQLTFAWLNPPGPADVLRFNEVRGPRVG